MLSSLARSLVPLVIAAGLNTACGSPVGVDETVSASITGTTLRIENHSSAPVYYFAVEQDEAAAINWAPCVEGRHCTVIPAKTAKEIPLAEVSGFEPTSQVVLVNWWRRVPGPTISRYRAGEIRVIQVQR